MANYVSTHTGEQIDSAIVKALKLDDIATTSIVTVSGIAYFTLWKVAPTASNQVYGFAIHPDTGKLTIVYNNRGTYSVKPFGNVTSVNGVDGDVVLNDVKYTDQTSATTSAQRKAARVNLDLGNVNNTSDADKPISTATQNALDTLRGLISTSATSTNKALSASEIQALIKAVTDKISSAATTSNKVLSASEIDAKIAAVEAKQLYANSTQGQFATRADLFAASTFYDAAGNSVTPTKNDVAYVIADELHEDKNAKYVVTATTPSLLWGFVIAFSDYKFNDTQMAAINSGITSEKISEIDSDLDTKVDKVEGKELSSNDFTDDYVNKLSAFKYYSEYVFQNDPNERVWHILWSTEPGKSDKAFGFALHPVWGVACSIEYDPSATGEKYSYKIYEALPYGVHSTLSVDNILPDENGNVSLANDIIITNLQAGINSNTAAINTKQDKITDTNKLSYTLLKDIPNISIFTNDSNYQTETQVNTTTNTKITAHNQDSAAHQDIRDAITANISADISAHNEDPTAHPAIRDSITDSITTHNQDSEAHTAIRNTLNAAIAAKYTKPSSGIPKTDLASAVKTSLGKADTALQSVPTTDNISLQTANNKYSIKAVSTDLLTNGTDVIIFDCGTATGADDLDGNEVSY